MFIFISSDQITLVQPSKFQFLCLAGKKKHLFLYYDLQRCSLQNIVNSLGRERKRKGRVDEVSGLNSILSLPSGNTQQFFSC